MGRAEEDIEAIKVLKARYFRYIDTKCWDGVRSLFVEDARFDFPGLGRFTGIDVFVETLQSVFAGATTIHHGHMPEIELTGADTACGVWAMEDYVIRPDGASASLPGYPDALQRGLRGYGHYHESYERHAAGWRIASLRLERLHVEPLPE